MKLTASKEGWKLSGAYSLDSLLKIKSELPHYGVAGNVVIDVSKLDEINAPVLSLLLEIRRHSDAVLLTGGYDGFYEMLKLYGLESIFDIA